MSVALMTKIPREWQDLGPVLSIQDIKDLMNVHENTVKKWIAEDKLPAFKQGRVIRIYRSDFLRFAGVDGGLD